MGDRASDNRPSRLVGRKVTANAMSNQDLDPTGSTRQRVIDTLEGEEIEPPVRRALLVIATSLDGQTRDIMGRLTRLSGEIAEDMRTTRNRTTQVGVGVILALIAAVFAVAFAP